jgi:acyl carrier protein
MHETVLTDLRAVFRSLFDQPDLQLLPHMATGDLPGWDSFRNVEILMACEERWGIRFLSSEIDGLLTAGDLAACLARKLVQP